MGGFDSAAAGASSAASGSFTSSGVPLGNAGGDSGSSFSISSTPSVSSSSFAVPDTSSSDWTSQAWQPSQAVAQPANLLESSSGDWTPKSAPQTTPVNYLEADSAPKPIASPNPLPSNSLLGSNNLLETSTQEKINPIVSKLARENSSNAPLLSQSLIGAPEAPKPLTTPNPLAKPDDWPKMPKVDWSTGTAQVHGLLGPQKPMTPDQANAIESMKTYPQWREDNLPAIQSRYQGILSRAEAAKTQQAQPVISEQPLVQATEQNFSDVRDSWGRTDNSQASPSERQQVSNDQTSAQSNAVTQSAEASSSPPGEKNRSYVPGKIVYGQPSYSTSLTKEQIQTKAQENGGWLTPKDVDKGNDKECVSLARALIPELPKAYDWRKGQDIPGPNESKLPVGTAIATFGKDGKYGSDGLRHTFVIAGYKTDNNGNPGIDVAEQWNGGKVRIRFIPYDNSTEKNTRYRLENYSAITSK